MSEPELSRPVDVRQAEGKAMSIVASEAERVALSERFGLVRIDRLEAEIELHRKDRRVTASGTLSADFVQSCAVSAEDLPVSIDEDLLFRFVPPHSGYEPEEEIEIDAEDCDEIEYEGTHFDVGEAVAQSLALAIDPFATGPEADETRRKAGISDEASSGPFAALAALKKPD
ncbi:metal-binding protein [Novosphingobium marinum]|uniref:Uncharacterized metal-binding protein YceD (DUF177 family) n=1 Tax=Novosphingobium marinum TaxID=1514948 RepID=A0A7Y9Y1B5_9SPHN|nr:YceD family protein [Novosphingobium marinum]NYH96913.1 uncharacterized metal-binding protein YceD (DUF177 family) [Novosphingobium marinum]GGC42413.1 metal-binding protein [Novosphingobium marinum]